ncbi:nucleoside recognition protein [Pseudovibrio sp. SPO723]|uniref:nucleoside recognition protein n=1 Tax=Nesiotobacter zosterae TaxID=392721 RepID=UPI0029C37AB3|nr:nucleoside recognition protein [Pseudovibrio sp. SPO723]MDX5592196.1 nucleoside recognition protein [Pseudovibrio sp. SPO723]
MNVFILTAFKLGKDAIRLFIDMVKVMVPIMILVRIAIEFGAVEHLASFLSPVMGIAGLPAETGLVFATGLLVNNYGALAAMMGLLPGMELTVAQVTVLLSMVLIAHALPLEQGISRKAGVSFIFSSGLRLVVGMAYGVVLNLIYAWGDWLQQPLDLSWLPVVPQADETWLQWAWSSASLLFSLFWIILALIIFLKLLEVTGITGLLTRLFAPLLSLMGISPKATNVTMIGVLLGLSYGGGLIIREAQAGNLSSRDVVLSVSFMGLCHGLIEDPLVMMAFGGHYSGVLIGRFVFTVIAMILISRLMLLLPEQLFERFFYRPARA